MWLSRSSKFALVYQILSTLDDFSLRYGDFTIHNMAAVLKFRNFDFLSPDLHGHAILLPYAKVYWQRAIRCWIMTKNYFKMAAIRYLEF